MLMSYRKALVIQRKLHTMNEKKKKVKVYEKKEKKWHKEENFNSHIISILCKCRCVNQYLIFLGSVGF